jgi:general stress protein YciG
VAEKDTSNRGFGSMDQERQREIASEGGRAAHEKGSAHEFNSEEARAAGRKGGEAVSSDRGHMSEIGRKGGEHSHSSNGGRSMQDDHDGGAGSNRGNDRDTQQGSHDRGSDQNGGEKTRGGSSEQHAEAGRQSHKNS